MKVGDKVLFYSSRLLPLNGITYTGTIVQKLVNPRFPDSVELAQYKIRLDKKIFWLISAYEWKSGSLIWGWQPADIAEPERLSTL